MLAIFTRIPIADCITMKLTIKRSLAGAFLLAGYLVLHSCANSAEENKGKVMARVFDYYLYESDVDQVAGDDLSVKDSTELVREYINNWVHEMLVLHKAESNLSDEQKNVEKQLNEYRKSLITYNYEKELVKQKLDTMVSEAEIEQYYNDNKSNFELKDNIIKVRFIKLSKKAPYIEKVKKWYKSDTEKDKTSLQSYCIQFAQNFYLDDESWLYFDDLLKEIPIETYNQELFLKNNRWVEVEDYMSYYFVNIKGFRIKNTLSPLAMEKEKVRNIILNKRKLELIKKMKEDIYEDAIKSKDIELYEN